MLVALAYHVYGYVSAERRLRATCALIQPGASLKELAAFARDHGLNEPSRLYRPTYLMEPRTFGRYGCRVDVEGDRVSSSTYVFRG